MGVCEVLRDNSYNCTLCACAKVCFGVRPPLPPPNAREEADFLAARTFLLREVSLSSPDEVARLREEAVPLGEVRPLVGRLVAAEVGPDDKYRSLRTFRLFEFEKPFRPMSAGWRWVGGIRVWVACGRGKDVGEMLRAS